MGKKPPVIQEKYSKKERDFTSDSTNATDQSNNTLVNLIFNGRYIKKDMNLTYNNFLFANTKFKY